MAVYGALADDYQASETVSTAGYIFPHYLQSNYKGTAYGSSNISTSGCGPSSVSILLAGLLGDASITPESFVSNLEAYYPNYNSYYVPGVGSKQSALIDNGFLHQYYPGVKSRAVASQNEAIAAIQTGKVGLGGVTGHILAIVPVPEEYQGQGYQFYIIDPAVSRGLDGPYRSSGAVPYSHSKPNVSGNFKINYILELE